MTEQNKLLGIREQIDTIDEKIQSLINQRAQCAQQVAEIKMKAGKTAHFYRPEREAQVLVEIKKRNKGPLGDDAMVYLFREIMSACLALEKPIKVSFLGPAGTYNHVAANKHFGSAIEQSPVENIEEIFRSVESGQVHFGVAPIENSTEGVISHTLDLLINSSLKICGEVDLRIQHNLISDEASLDTITKVYSHQQSLAQCRRWLDANLPAAEHYAVRSNAEAVRLAKTEKGAAAIAGAKAAEIYKVPVLCPEIEDEPDNTTRFIVIGRNEVPPSGSDRTSLLVTTNNKPGALHHLLRPLAERGIGMSKIESRPSHQGVWEYVFFIDIEGHKNDRDLSDALAEIGRDSAMVRILGSYPKAILK
ncbi:Chorismate mutase I / Prephenate dehydratase [hydrothermal vent metagenome]|uniref:Bifunctional chorismate mutase/prephenate dehydratase n=1 Tax=hydrothermal vent metagenome TaxID=652676 RepID=A0A3B0XBV6_9ZZZZ